MNQMRNLWVVAAAAAVVLLLSATAFGSDIKTRMKERLPQIVELKAAGIIGENSQGFLAFVGSNHKGQAVVDAENRDRRQVYTAIAKQQGTTPELVGQRRALQLFSNAKAGEWLQKANGQWVRK